MASKRDHVVVIHASNGRGECYIGSLGDCGRQGVKLLEHASRFTRRGAFRVAMDYSHAEVRKITFDGGAIRAMPLT